MQLRQEGDLFVADFLDNVGGLNTSDSPFKVKDDQATGGKNFQYSLTGGFQKRPGSQYITPVPDAQLRTKGLSIFKPAMGGTNTPIRAAGTKLQTLNLSTGATVNLTTDAASPSSAVFSSLSTQQVVFSEFNTTAADMLWAAGGGAPLPVAVTSTTKLTVNGTPAPAGSITATAGGSDGTLTAGKYFYAVSFVKTSTSNEGNVALDIGVTITSAQHVTIGLSGITAFDQTTYGKINIYRSAVAGVSGFTTGDLIASVASSTTSYVDTGAVPSAVLTNVPRAGNTILDQSTLPPGTYNTLTTWKRRLVTASGSTLYITDVNKPEAWPLANLITIPSGSPITGIAIITHITPLTLVVDEYLCIFKDQEVWTITGDTPDGANNTSAWALQFIDYVGSTSQTGIVSTNGFLAWIDYRGVFLWDGASKPIYASRTIADIFKSNGDVDLTKLHLCVGKFSRDLDQIVWFLSSDAEGEQQFSIKLDTRLTLPSFQGELGSRVIDAVLITDASAYPIYAIDVIRPAAVEFFVGGDASGLVYNLFSSPDDIGAPVNFTYATKFADLGSPGVSKTYHKVIAWIQDTSTTDVFLDYWTNYVDSEETKKVRSAQIAAVTSEALWDEVEWDDFFWGPSINASYRPVVFNLGGATGDCIRLQFRQSLVLSPLVIAGFSVVFSKGGMQK